MRASEPSFILLIRLASHSIKSSLEQALYFFQHPTDTRWILLKSVVSKQRRIFQENLEQLVSEREQQEEFVKARDAFINKKPSPFAGEGGN